MQLLKQKNKTCKTKEAHITKTKSKIQHLKIQLIAFEKLAKPQHIQQLKI